jgi:magnesium transporter
MIKTTPLAQLVQEFVDRDAAAAARRLEAMAEEDAIAVVRALPLRSTALILPHLQISFAASLLRAAGDADLQPVMRGMDPERAAAIFMHLPEDARERLSPFLTETVRRHVRDHLAYPEDSVARVMSPMYLSFPKSLTVREVTRKLRAAARKQPPGSYAYVVDENGVLEGVMNMYDLLLASPSSTLESVMRTDVFALPAFTSVEEAARELAKRRYFAVPVVDGEKRILGIAKAERLIRGAQQEIGEDLQKMFGAGGDEGAFSPVRYSLRKRLPWLHVNLATAFMAAGVVALFEPIIARLTVLAVFLPVVAGQGGNAGAQSLAVVMRGIVMREIPRNRWRRLVLKEAWLGVIAGAATGLVTGIIAWAWYGSGALGFVIALAMLANLCCAGLAGASIPLVLKSVGLDPAQCSNIILTTVTDVVGFFAFLGLAFLFESMLMTGGAG